MLWHHWHGGQGEDIFGSSESRLQYLQEETFATSEAKRRRGLKDPAGAADAHHFSKQVSSGFALGVTVEVVGAGCYSFLVLTGASGIHAGAGEQMHFYLLAY